MHACQERDVDVAATEAKDSRFKPRDPDPPMRLRTQASRTYRLQPRLGES